MYTILKICTNRRVASPRARNSYYTKPDWALYESTFAAVFLQCQTVLTYTEPSKYQEDTCLHIYTSCPSCIRKCKWKNTKVKTGSFATENDMNRAWRFEWPGNICLYCFRSDQILSICVLSTATSTWNIITKRKNITFDRAKYGLITLFLRKLLIYAMKSLVQFIDVCTSRLFFSCIIIYQQQIVVCIYQFPAWMERLDRTVSHID